MTSTRPGHEAGHAHQIDVDVAALWQHIEVARSAAPTPDTLIAALETAHEELRVAGEEVRTQRETIDRLVASHKNLQMHQERTLGILPVPAFITDMHGTIRSVNAAAAVLTETRIPHLLGKPLVSLFSHDDRHDLRRMISEQGRAPRDGQVIRRTATLTHRRGGTGVVELSGAVQQGPAAQGEIAWFLLSPSDSLAAEGLSEGLAALAMLARRERDLPTLLSAAATSCAVTMGAHVTISVGPPSDPQTVMSSSQLAQECDGAQLATGAGPTLDAHTRRATVVTRSLAEDERWPELAGRLPHAVGTALATPVTVLDRVVGTLTVYAPPGTELAEDVALLLAVTLGGLLHELDLLDEVDRLHADMEHALASRSIIEQAKGIIMAARGVDADGAWQHLLRLSSEQERKVRDIARDVVAEVVDRR